MKEKYEAWYPLLEKELGLVAKPDAKIISIGGKVGGFLTEKGLYGHAGAIPHYSGSAARHRGKEIPGREPEFEKFASSLGAIPGYSRKPGHSCETDHEPSKIIKITPSDSRKKLLFDYKVGFGRIKEQNPTRWLEWQREWQLMMKQKEEPTGQPG